MGIFRRIVSVLTAAATVCGGIGCFAAGAGAEQLPDLTASETAEEGYTWDFAALYETTYLGTDGSQGWKGANASPYLSCTTDTISVADEKLTETAADTLGIEYVSGKDGNAELKSTGLYSVYCGNLSFTYTAPDDGTIGIELAAVTDGTAFGVSPSTDVTQTDTVFSFVVTANTTYTFVGATPNKWKTTIKSISYTPMSSDDIAAGYDAVTLNGINARVKAADGADTVLVYLHSSARNGTENAKQILEAEPLFDLMDGTSALAAPQTADVWDADALGGFISEFKMKYGVSRVVAAGTGEGAAACCKLAETGAVDAIMPISGAADALNAEAIKDNGVSSWIFAGYGDNSAAYSDIRDTAAALQEAGAVCEYTEYPFSEGNVIEEVSKESTVSEWILGNAAEQSKTVDLVLFAGQSNMAGRGEYADAVECKPGHGYEYHAVTEPGVLSTVEEPFGKYENNDAVNDNGSSGTDRREGDMVSALMESYYEQTGVPIVAVQCSRGGTSTDWWTSETVLSEAAARFNEAAEFLESGGYTVRRKFMVWCQGESDADAGKSAETYINNTTTIFDTLENSAGITDEFVVRTGHYNFNYGLSDGESPSEDALLTDEKYTVINVAQKTLCDTDAQAQLVASFYADEYLADMKDKYHYHQATYNAVGDLAGYNIAACYDDSLDEKPIQEPEISINGVSDVAKLAGGSYTAQYSIYKNYIDDNEKYAWSVTGVQGVTIDDNGVLTVSSDAAEGYVTVTAEITQSDTAAVGTVAEKTVYVHGYAVVKSYDLDCATTLGVGDKTEISVCNVVDTYGCDISDSVTIKDVSSSDAETAAAEGNVVTGVKSGTANVTFTIDTGSDDPTNAVTSTFRVGIYEITSSDTSIDVSGMASYGTNTFRVYSSDGSCADVTAENGIIANVTGDTVTVVPCYRFEFTNLESSDDEHINGYVKVGESSYSPETGYGLLSDSDYKINNNGCYAVSGCPIKADVPVGYYDITVYRNVGTRMDLYSEGVQIANNTTSSGSQNRGGVSALMRIPQVDVHGGDVDLTMGNTGGKDERIASVEIVRVPDKYRKPIIWVAGDSESANYYPIDADGEDLYSDKIMMTGFGTQLRYFMSDKYEISNFGQPSATAGTWNDECLSSVSARMRAGDVILIDFGINDAVSKNNSVDIETAEANIKKIVDAANAAGATPVILSPIYSIKYQSKSYFTYDHDTDSNVESAFADGLGAAFIDLNKYTMKYVSEAKTETGDESWLENNYHIHDNLHLTQHSALLTASFIAAGLNELGYETTDYSYEYEDISSVLDGYLRGETTGVSRVYNVVAALEFMNGDGFAAEISYSDGVVTIVTDDETLESAVLIRAERDGELLKDVRCVDITFEDGTSKTDMSVDDDTELYLWDSLTGMTPLAGMYSR